MNPKHVTFNYQAEAEQTNSPHYHATKVPRHHFENVINMAVDNLSCLDEVKKAIFYGRDLPEQTLYLFSTEEKLDQMFEPSSKAMTVPLVHSIIGIATEAGELLEIFDKPEFDRTNFIEEVGDVMWYIAIGLNAVGSTFEEAQRINIAKLRKRYPEKFTEYDANNRDLTAEREVLETPLTFGRSAAWEDGRNDSAAGREPSDVTLAALDGKGFNDYLNGYYHNEAMKRGGMINHGPVGREHGPELHSFSKPVYGDGSGKALAPILTDNPNKSFEIDGHRLNFQQAQTYIALKQTGKLGELLDGYQIPL